MPFKLTYTDAGLITADNCAVMFIDFQPQMVFGVGSIDRQLLINNMLMLAKGAKLFNIPTIITTIESASFSGYALEQLRAIIQLTPIERTGMNSWDNEQVRQAVKATGKKNIIVSGLWTEVCVAWPTLHMLNEGYNVFIVEDACGGTSLVTHNAALKRCYNHGAQPMTSLATVLEFQRDWAHKDTYDGVMTILREHAGAYGVGVEYAYSMLK